MVDVDYRTLYEQLPGAVIISDATTGRILDCNSAAERLTARSRDEMIGMHQAGLLSGSHATNTHAEFVELVKKGHATYYKSGIVTKRGENIPVVINASHVKANGRDAVMQVLTLPIEGAVSADHGTPAENDLRPILAAAQDTIVIADRDLNNEKLLAALIENSSDGFAILDAEGIIRYESRTIERILGYESEERIGKRIFDFIHPDDLRRVAASFADFINNPRATQTNDMRYLHKDGSWRWMEGIGKNLLHDPRIKGIVVSFRDITAHKQAEVALQESEKKYRTLVELASIGIIFIQGTMVKYANPRAPTILGYTREEMIGSSMIKFLHPEEIPKVMERYKRRMAGEEVPKIYESALLHKDGRRVDVEIAATATTYEGGLADLVVIRDITDRKHIEEALRASEARFRQLIDLLPQPVFEMDLEFNVILTNRAGLESFGYTQEDLAKGVKVSALVTQEDWSRAVASVSQRLAGEEIRNHEYTAVRKDGSTFPVLIYSSLITQDNKPIGLRGILVDISERKRAEQALKEREERFRTLIENSSDAITIFDADGTVRYLSPSIEQMMGYKTEELEGKNLLEYLHPDDLKAMQDRVGSLYSASGRIQIDEWRFRHKDGLWHIIEGTGRNLLDDPNIQGLVANFRDVTERRRSQTALQESEERFRNLVEAAPDIIFTLSAADGTITSLNYAFEKVLGQPRDEWLGKPYTGVIHPEDLPIAEQRYKRMLQGESPAPFEVRLLSKSGQPVIGQITAIPRVESGKVSGVLGFVRDITAQWLVEEEMRRSQERLTVLFEYAPDSYHLTDSRGIILSCNRAAEEVLGLKREEMIGRTFPELNLLSPEDIPKSAESFHASVKGKATGPDEVTIVRRDGHRVPIEVRTRPIAIGDEILFLTITHDITNRKKAEQALRDSERKFREIFHSVNDEITYVGIDGTILDVNERCYEIFGQRREEQLGRNILELGIFDQEQLPKVVEAFTTAMAKNEPGLMEIEATHIDGHKINIEASYSPIVSPDGQVSGCLGVLRDVTERRRTERALQDREAKLKQIFHAVRDEIVLVDLTGKVLEVNSSVQKIFGFSPDEVIGRNFMELNIFDADELAPLVKSFTDAMVRGSAAQGLTEVRARRKDGQEVYVEVNATTVTGPGGELAGWLCTLRDITDRNRAEEELARVKRESDAQVIQSAKLASLGEMATGIAHEVNQPLNVIKMTTTGLLGFMKRGKEIKQEMLKSELEKTDRQVERMRVIIDHLRTFARRSTDLSMEQIDVNVPVQDCFKMIGQQLKLREIDLQIDLQELPKVFADTNKLEQVFLNIIGNARDAMDDLAKHAGEGYKKTLKVRSYRDGNMVVVAITDTGGGIPKEHRHKMFEPFFTTKEPGKGTGLGLSISYNIIKDFRGTLDFTVEEGVGTTFRVALPAAEAAGAKTEAEL